MSEPKKKTVTVKFTAAEADWLLAKLERIATEARADSRAENRSWFKEHFQAESLMDRIRSEQ